MKFKPSQEALNLKPDAYKKYYISIPMKWNIFGKEIVRNVDFQVNEDGSIDPRVVDTFNKFFPKLDQVLKSNMSLILKNVGADSKASGLRANLTQADIEKHFDKLTSCFVGIEKINAGGQVAYTDHVIAHCSLEWLYSVGDNDDVGTDAEHGNGFAMIDGKFYMGKPGDFY